MKRKLSGKFDLVKKYSILIPLFSLRHSLHYYRPEFLMCILTIVYICLIMKKILPDNEF